MSHLHLENIKPVRAFFQKLQKLYPAPWHHHEVRVQGKDGKTYKIFIPEGRPDMIAVVSEGVYEIFEHIEEACRYLREKVGLTLLPSECARGK